VKHEVQEVMIHRVASPKHHRAAILGTVFALHAALIALFLQQSVQVAPEVRPTSVAMVALQAERPAAAKPPPPDEEELDMGDLKNPFRKK